MNNGNKLDNRLYKKVDRIFNKIEDIYNKQKKNINKLGRLGIDIDPHKYDFVFSHIPVGKLIKISDHFNFNVIFDKPQKTTFYIHIPFCLKECTYCYFIKDVGENVRSFKNGIFSKNRLHTKPDQNELKDWEELGLSTIDRVNEYLFYLKEEFDILCKHFKYWHCVDSIYIGGGTPSFLFENELDFLFKEIVNKIKEKIKNDSNNGTQNADIEIAMEIHPELMVAKYRKDKIAKFNTENVINNNRINESKLQKIIELGVNRLSFGIQTFDAEILRKINRDNRGHKSLIEKLKKEKIDNWNLDMIYGLPGQDLESLKKDIEIILEIKPPSITWYQLWYSPRKKEREIKLKKFKNDIPSKQEIIKFKLLIHEVLTKCGYENISGDWYVTEDKFYTRYERYKVEAEGNIGIGIGAYQYYGNYIFENSSGNGNGKNIDWSDYYNKIKDKKLPITWLRKVNENELYLRKVIMGIKGEKKPEPIKKEDMDKHLKYSDKLSHIYDRINRLKEDGIFDNEITLKKDFWIFRDYIIIYLLEKYGWNIEKSGLLESLDGIDVYEAKDTFYYELLPKILKDKENYKVSIAFFAAVFDENIEDYDLNFSSNYIFKKAKIIKKKIPSTVLKSNSFSFLKTFYTRPGNLQKPICIVINTNEKHRDDAFDLPNINIKNLNQKSLEQFLKTVELDYEEKKLNKDFKFVETYYKNLATELHTDSGSDTLCVYHIPFFENYGVGGIELALNKILSKNDLKTIRNGLLPFFVDRISKEINAFEKYNIQKHALKSAISSIMARNLSHIHGSHIEPGIQNNMDKFKGLLSNRISNGKRNL